MSNFLQAVFAATVALLAAAAFSIAVVPPATPADRSIVAITTIAPARSIASSLERPTSCNAFVRTPFSPVSLSIPPETVAAYVAIAKAASMYCCEARATITTIPVTIPPTVDGTNLQQQLQVVMAINTIAQMLSSLLGSSY